MIHSNRINSRTFKVKGIVFSERSLNMRKCQIFFGKDGAECHFTDRVYRACISICFESFPESCCQVAIVSWEDGICLSEADRL